MSAYFARHKSLGIGPALIHRRDPDAGRCAAAPLGGLPTLKVSDNFSHRERRLPLCPAHHLKGACQALLVSSGGGIRYDLPAAYIRFVGTSRLCGRHARPGHGRGFVGPTASATDWAAALQTGWRPDHADYRRPGRQPAPRPHPDTSRQALDHLNPRRHRQSPRRATRAGHQPARPCDFTDKLHLLGTSDTQRVIIDLHWVY